MSYKIHTLSKVSLFSSLEDEQLKQIASITIEKSYRKNEVIFHENDSGSALFILRSGTVKISLVDPNGKEAILKMLYENDFFGEMSLLDGHFRSATVIAMEDCKALSILQKDFVRFIKQYPSIILSIVSTLSRRLRKTDEKIAALVFSDSYGKTARVLLDLAAEKGKRVGNSVVLEFPVSRQEMASIAGMSRETLTRMLNEFQVRGCLKLEGKKIVILDEAILKRELI